MTLKKDTRRDLGKRLVNREVGIWEENGWLIDDNKRWVWTKDGMRQVTITDYFGRYDFMAAWPEGGIMALVQVSKTSEGKHEEPLGFNEYDHAPWVSIEPSDLLLEPNPRETGKIGTFFAKGVYEIYVYYRKLKTVAQDGSRRGILEDEFDANQWVPDRRWWVRK